MSSSAINAQLFQAKIGSIQNQADSSSVYSAGVWSFKNSTALTSVTITDSGNVGIGTSLAPWSARGKAIEFANGSLSGSITALNSGLIQFATNTYAAATTDNYTAAGAATRYYQYQGTHVWENAASGAANGTITWAERMRIDALGAFTFQTTSNVGSAKAFLIKNAGETSNGRNTVTLDAANVGNNSSMISFAKSGGAIWNVLVDRTATGTSDFGIISSSGNGVYLANTSSTSWTGTSDKRVKKNIQPLELGLEQIKALKPSRFDYNTDESEESARVGFIAQEVLPILPHAVHVPEDSEQMMGVSATEMIPVLVKAIQELSAKVDAQAAEIEALKAK